MDGYNGFDYYEQNYADQKWWNDMKDRMKNKNEIQKDLDRKLIEQIGNPDEKPKINLPEIKKLVEQGALPDHWVDYYGRSNVVQLAAENGSDEAIDAIGRCFYKRLLYKIGLYVIFYNDELHIILKHINLKICKHSSFYNS